MIDEVDESRRQQSGDAAPAVMALNFRSQGPRSTSALWTQATGLSTRALFLFFICAHSA